MEKEESNRPKRVSAEQQPSRTRLKKVAPSLARAVVKSIPYVGAGLDQAIFGSMEALANNRDAYILQQINERTKLIVHISRKVDGIVRGQKKLQEQLNDLSADEGKERLVLSPDKPGHYGGPGRRWGKVEDLTNALTQEEKSQLRSFIRYECLSFREDREHLSRIVLRRDLRSGYLGYWSGKLDILRPHVTHFRGVIVLNRWYLLTVEEIKRQLAHEYGHHFVNSYIIRRTTDYPNSLKRVLEPYYKIRELSPKDVRTDADWKHNVFELLAEDYVYFFTTLTCEHGMKHLFGYPPPQVKGFILGLRSLTRDE